MAHGRGSVVLFAVGASLGACVPDLPIATQAAIECGPAGECPSGTSCKLNIHRCVALEGADQTPPELLTSGLSVDTLAPGDTLTITLTVDEPLAAAPEVTVVTPGSRAASSCDNPGTTIACTYVASGNESDGPSTVEVTILDLAGNQGGKTVAGPAFDSTPPAIQGLVWVRGASQGALSPTATVDFIGSVEAGSTLDGAFVVDPAGTHLCDASVATGADDPGRPGFVQVNGTANLGACGLGSAASVAIELSVQDAVGNRTPPSLSRGDYLALDGDPPTDATVSIDGPNPTNQREVVLSLHAVGAVEVWVEGQVLDDDNTLAWVPYTLALPVVLTVGNETKCVTVHFRDLAYNEVTPPDACVDLQLAQVDPTPPDLLAPLTGTYVNGLSPELRWTPRAGAGVYTLQVTEEPSGVDVLVPTDMTATSKVLDLQSSTYRARVWTDLSGPSSYGESTFHVVDGIVYVACPAATGCDAAGVGTLARPMPSISSGIRLAARLGLGRVEVAGLGGGAELYDNLVATPGVDVYGGYAPDFQSRGDPADQTTVRGQALATLLALQLTGPVVFDGLTLLPPDIPNETVYTVYAYASGDYLTLRNCGIAGHYGSQVDSTTVRLAYTDAHFESCVIYGPNTFVENGYGHSYAVDNEFGNTTFVDCDLHAGSAQGDLGAFSFALRDLGNYNGVGAVVSGGTVWGTDTPDSIGTFAAINSLGASTELRDGVVVHSGTSNEDVWVAAVRAENGADLQISDATLLGGISYGASAGLVLLTSSATIVRSTLQTNESYRAYGLVAVAPLRLDVRDSLVDGGVGYLESYGASIGGGVSSVAPVVSFDAVRARSIGYVGSTTSRAFDYRAPTGSLVLKNSVLSAGAADASAALWIQAASGNGVLRITNDTLDGGSGAQESVAVSVWLAGQTVDLTNDVLFTGGTATSRACLIERDAASSPSSLRANSLADCGAAAYVAVSGSGTCPEFFGADCYGLAADLNDATKTTGGAAGSVAANDLFLTVADLSLAPPDYRPGVGTPASVARQGIDTSQSLCGADGLQDCGGVLADFEATSRTCPAPPDDCYSRGAFEAP